MPKSDAQVAGDAHAQLRLEIPPGYRVTRDGRVFSRRRGKWRELRQGMNGSAKGRGYPSVRLRRPDGSRWHVAVYRLVAAAYLPPRPSRRHFVCHVNGDHLDSRASNLRWDTQRGNMLDAWEHRRQRQAAGWLPFDLPDASAPI